jgi:hypothetical protein
MLSERNGVGDWGSARVATEKMYSPTDSGQASKTPCAMTVAQIDQALRDFILQDTAHLRREAETANPETSQREPAAPQIASDFVRHMAGASLTKLEETIVDLSQLRDFLHVESERIKREISSYLQFNDIAIGSTKNIVDNIAQWKRAAHSIARTPEQSDFVGSEIPVRPFPATAADVFIPTK